MSRKQRIRELKRNHASNYHLCEFSLKAGCFPDKIKIYLKNKNNIIIQIRRKRSKEKLSTDLNITSFLKNTS